MKRLTLLLTTKTHFNVRRTVVFLACWLCFVVFPVAVAEAFPCYQNGKWIPPEPCARFNINEYAHWAYAQPQPLSWYVKATSVGRYHAIYRVLVQVGGPDAGLLVPRRVRFSARACGNRFCVYDHRKGTWWP